MTCASRIPYRYRDESLIDTASHARTLGHDEGRVTRHLVVQALMDGVAKSGGELLDHLNQLAPGERRALLDQARVAAGLPDIETVEHRQRIHDLATRIDVDPSLQSCHAPGCRAVPTTPAGAWRPVNVRRWTVPITRTSPSPAT